MQVAQIAIGGYKPLGWKNTEKKDSSEYLIFKKKKKKERKKKAAAAYGKEIQCR